MSVTVQVREFDGGRSVEVTRAGDFIVLEAAGHAFAFDRAHVLHQMKKLMGISVILEHEGLEEDFALP